MAVLLLMSNIVAIAVCHFFTTILGQSYSAPHLVCNGALVAPFPEQRVNGLYMVPALLHGDLWEVCGRFLVSLLIDELNAHTVDTDLPVHIVPGVLKVGQDGDRAMKIRKLLLRDGAETTVLHGTGDSIFPETTVKIGG